MPGGAATYQRHSSSTLRCWRRLHQALFMETNPRAGQNMPPVCLAFPRLMCVCRLCEIRDVTKAKVREVMARLGLFKCRGLSAA